MATNFHSTTPLQRRQANLMRWGVTGGWSTVKCYFRLLFSSGPHAVGQGCHTHTHTHNTSSRRTHASSGRLHTHTHPLPVLVLSFTIFTFLFSRLEHWVTFRHFSSFFSTCALSHPCLTLTLPLPHRVPTLAPPACVPGSSAQLLETRYRVVGGATVQRLWLHHPSRSPQDRARRRFRSALLSLSLARSLSLTLSHTLSLTHTRIHTPSPSPSPFPSPSPTPLSLYHALSALQASPSTSTAPRHQAIGLPRTQRVASTGPRATVRRCSLPASWGCEEGGAGGGARVNTRT